MTDNTELDTDAELEALLKELGSPTHTSPRFAGNVPWVRPIADDRKNLNPHATSEPYPCACRECVEARS